MPKAKAIKPVVKKNGEKEMKGIITVLAPTPGSPKSPLPHFPERAPGYERFAANVIISKSIFKSDMKDKRQIFQSARKFKSADGKGITTDTLNTKLGLTWGEIAVFHILTPKGSAKIT
jgi:hypothetical protein